MAQSGRVKRRTSVQQLVVKRRLHKAPGYGHRKMGLTKIKKRLKRF